MRRCAVLSWWVWLGCGLATASAPEIAAADHWAFRPVVRPAAPVVEHKEQVRTGVDAFLLARLEREGLTFSPETERTTLIRRVTLDLIGLPPTREEVAAFLQDERPDAYERLVDRLLASPRYGERWARPWLDLCHYGDSDGHLTDQLRPVAWRYRDWLIAALNCNQPFDEFTLDQLAGDLRPNATEEQRIATGFLRQTLSNREGGADLEEYRVAQVVDRLNMVGTAWLGLTVGCAQCHDHKYDPLTQREYYQLYAFLNNADEVNIDAPLPEERAAWESSRNDYARRRQEILAPVAEAVAALQKRWEEKLLHAAAHPGADHVWDRQWELLGLVWGGGLGEGQLEGTEIVRLPRDRRTPRQQADLLDYFLRGGSVIDPAQFNALQLAQIQTRLQELRKEFPSATRAPVMQAALTPRPNYIHERGEFRSRGADVQPGTPEWLPTFDNRDAATRLDLARWLVAPQQPLTPRVVANRLWQEFFGRGLVLTAEDFGTRGDPPTHPELLDWLATELVSSGWDIKALQRLIVTSSAYRQSSRPRPEAATRDPANRWLSHQSSLRLSAEAIRDAALATSGLLSDKIGGPGVRPPQPDRVVMESFGYNDWKTSTGEDRYRRGLYTFLIRTAPFAQAVTFDAPGTSQVCARRTRSNTPLQALTLLNDPVFVEMAEQFARRMADAAPGDDRARIAWAFELATARAPTLREVDRLHAFLVEERDRCAAPPPSTAVAADAAPPDPAWTQLCSVLLNLHEFITRD